MGRSPVTVGCRVVSHDEYLAKLMCLSEKLTSLMERPYFACGGSEVPWPDDPEADALMLAITDHYAWQSRCLTCERHRKAIKTDMPKADRDYLLLCFRAMGMHFPSWAIRDVFLAHRRDNPFIRVAFLMLDDKYYDEELVHDVMEQTGSVIVFEREVIGALVDRIAHHVMPYGA
jgi:hypothetical protein